MKFATVPSEVWPLILSKDQVARFTPVTSLDIYDGASSEYHDQGLYSTSIFGRVGSDERETTFSYIDLGVSVIHPKYYRDLISLKSFYKEVLAGRKTALFDKVSGEFIPDSGPNARTGYSFFMEHFKDIKLKPSKSITRQQRIKFIEDHKGNCMVRYLPVMPAGLRDLEINDNGTVTKNEIHDLYYRALSISNTIPNTDDKESPAFDIARSALTNTLVAIYELIEGMISGKNGFMLSKWASRRVAYGTRNVLTVMETSIANLDDSDAPGPDATTFGLFQVLKSLTPVAIHHLRKATEMQINVGEGQARLIDKKTLKAKWVDISPRTRDLWATRDGLDDVIDSYQMLEMRHRPVEIEDHYLALIYKGPDMTFKIFHDIDELPDHLDRKHAHPINLVELLYLCGYSKWNGYFSEVSRYPISGSQSLYASRIYVKTTIIGERRRELDDNWQPYEGDEYVALEFPLTGSTSYMDSQSPSSNRLKGLGADRTVLFTRDSK